VRSPPSSRFVSIFCLTIFYLICTSLPCRSEERKGTVIDERTGKPVEGATVYFFSLMNGRLSKENFDPTKQKDLQFTATTDANGTFSWKNAKHEDYGVFAFKVGAGQTIMANLAKERSGEPLAIKLEIAGSIEGFVNRKGKPVSGAKITLAVELRKPSRLSSLITGSYQLHTTSDQNGRFHFENVFGGTHYRLLVEESSFKNGGAYSSRNEPVYVRAGEKATCIIGAETGSSLMGHVTAPPGTSIIGARVNLMPRDYQVNRRYGTRVDANGNYEFADIAPGPYEIRIDGGVSLTSPSLFYSRRVTVIPNQALKKNVAIEPRVRIKPGVILDVLDAVDRQGRRLSFAGPSERRYLIWLYTPTFDASVAHGALIKELSSNLQSANVRVIPITQELPDPEEVEKDLGPLGLVDDVFYLSRIASHKFYSRHQFSNDGNSPLLLVDSHRKIIAIINNRAELEAAISGGAR